MFSEVTFFSFKCTTHNKTNDFRKFKTLLKEWNVPEPPFLHNFNNFVEILLFLLYFALHLQKLMIFECFWWSVSLNFHVIRLGWQRVKPEKILAGLWISPGGLNLWIHCGWIRAESESAVWNRSMTTGHTGHVEFVCKHTVQRSCTDVNEMHAGIHQ